MFTVHLEINDVRLSCSCNVNFLKPQSVYFLPWIFGSVAYSAKKKKLFFLFCRICLCLVCNSSVCDVRLIQSGIEVNVGSITSF